MPKWFLGKRRYKSPPSYDSLSSAADLNLQYNFIKYSIDSLLYHQPNHLAQESAAKKRVKPDEDDHLNGDRLSGASPDSGYSHSPLSYSYYVDHDNADIECTESAALLNTPNHPLDLSVKTSGVTFSKIDYETISRNVDVKKSEPLPIADSVYSGYLKSEQKLDDSNYEECRELLHYSGSHDCRDEVKDVIAVNNSFTPTSSHAQTNRMSKYIDSDTTMYGGKDMNTLVHDRSVTGMFNIASQLRCATQRGRNKDHKTKSRNKFRNNDISKSNGKSRTDKACDVCRRHEHPASDIKVNTLQLVQQLLSHDRNEIQTKRCLDSVMYRIPDHPVLSADETFGVRNKQADCLTVPISDQIETKQELIPFNEPRQSDEFVPSANCVTATRLTQGKTLTRIKSEKLSTAAKSSKLVRVKQSDAYYKYADFETLCRGDLDTSLTLVDATPEARAEIEKIENKIGDYACMLCCEIFSDAFQLAGHNCSGIVHVEYRCPECSKTFNCPANLASHRRWHKPQRALAVMSEWPLDDLLQSTRYSRTLSKLGKPMLL